MPPKEEAKEQWEIWAHVHGVKKAGAVSIANTATVDALCKAIKAEFQLSERIADWVVRAPLEPFPEGTDPKFVIPADFKQALDNPKATLAAVLKPTIAGPKGEYEVYVELPATVPGRIEKTVWLPSMAKFTPQKLPLYEEANPLTFIEPAGWLRKIKTLVTEEDKLEESRDSKRRVRPLCVARCSRGGKTRALQELARTQAR